jgi:hypothetical protein
MALSECTKRKLAKLPLLVRLEAVEELLVGEISEVLRRTMPLGKAWDRAEHSLVSVARMVAIDGAARTAGSLSHEWPSKPRRDIAPLAHRKRHTRSKA